MKIKSLIAGALILGAPSVSKAQTAFGDNLNVVTTAVPVLAIGPDARHGALANVGAATSVDANAMFWNTSKLAFLEEGTTDIALNYSPWLRRLVPDINLSYVSFATSIDKNQAIGASIRYFSLGEITFRNQQGEFQGTFSPYEMSVDVGYALKLSENWSSGIALRYIFSDLTQGQAAGINPGQSVSTDLSAYYRGDLKNLPDGQKGRFLFGAAITNLGAKISYSDGGNEDFLPTNLRLGAGYEWQLDDYNSLTVLADVNRLLVPTAPVRDDQTGEILEGEDDNVGVIAGVLQSFNPNAKPRGWEEFWEENMYNVGLEYWYDGIFAVRGGYQYESVNKGNRKFFTMGIGIRYSSFGFDFSYLIPANSSVRSPLENTLRFSLMVNLNGLSG
ncbi:MAG: type IX secretion system outer membrane channel protein PorV [Flavobacteriia bacterium]|nr:type IX secretion system outer membrane channel protein PorV [Flavobacteriia bacterium]